MKKIIIIIGIIILLLAGLGLLLLTQNGGNISIDRITSLFPDTENNPDAGVGGNGSDFGEETELFPDVDIDQEAFPFKQLFSGPVSGFIYTKENMVRFVERETGHIYDYDLATTDLAKASNKTIRGVREVLWKDDGQSLILRTINNIEKLENLYVTFNTDTLENQSFLFSFNKDLKRGDSGEDVKMMQITLNEDIDTQVSESGAGSPGNETDSFGPATERAVTAFQNKYSSEISINGDTEKSGELGPSTRAKLNEINKELFTIEIEEDLFEETELFTKPVVAFTDAVSNIKNDRILHINENGIGVDIVISKIDTSGGKLLLSSPFTDWVIDWPGSFIALNTRPSGGVEGNLYFVDETNGVLTKILSGIKSLTSKVNSDGSLVLYSQKRSIGNGFSTHIYETKENQSFVVNFTTLPEKCAWLTSDVKTLICGVPSEVPQGIYPDSWYKGKVSFNDKIWIFNTETQESDILFDPETETLSTQLDVYEPVVSFDEKYFLFLNKKDSTLWSLRLRS